MVVVVVMMAMIEENEEADFQMVWQITVQDMLALGNSSKDSPPRWISWLSNSVNH